MAQFQLYNYQFGQIHDVMPDLFSGQPLMSVEEAFSKKQQILGQLFDNDYDETERIRFTNKNGTKEYEHEHLIPPTDDIIVMRIANKRVRNRTAYQEKKFRKEMFEDYPTCVVIIDNRDGIQRMAIEANRTVFSTDVSLSNVIQNTISKALRKYNLNINLMKLQNPKNFWDCVNDTITYPMGFYKIKFHLPYLNLERLQRKWNNLSEKLRQRYDGRLDWEITAQQGGKLNLTEDDEMQKMQIEFLMDEVGGNTVELVPNNNKKKVIRVGTNSYRMVIIQESMIKRLEEEAKGNSLFAHEKSALNEIKLITKEGIA